MGEYRVVHGIDKESRRVETSEVVTEQGTSPQRGTAPFILPSTCVVELRYATLPRPLGLVAVHYWFALFDPGSRQWHRWEVWQAKDAGGQSFGHVHCDLRHPDCGVGGGTFRLAAEWSGRAAQAICSILQNAQDYPYRDRYRAWPGPNSNTFVSWVLRQASLHHAFDPRAIGKDYWGLIDMWRSIRPIGVQIETPVLGVKLSRHGGVELHLFCLTCGLRWSPLEINTPFGRVSLLRRVAPPRNAGGGADGL
jgi:hypothetical protein